MTYTTNATNARLARPKVKLGKDILEEYKTVSIGQSAYFTGELPPPLPVVYYFLELYLGGNFTKIVLLGTKDDVIHWTAQSQGSTRTQLPCDL